jgi:hypothetical protein
MCILLKPIRNTDLQWYLFVDEVGEVSPVIEDKVERLTVREVDGLLDTPYVLLVRLPLPGVHRHASRSNSGGRVILKNIIYKILWRISLNQGCGSRSGLDPDSIGSVNPDSESGSGSRRTKMTHKSRKKF